MQKEIPRTANPIKWLSFVACYILLTVLNVVPTTAAEISKSTTPECLIIINGTIEKGDYQKFKTLADEVFPGFDGESTFEDLVCLNSPGGSLSEGLAFASHFYKEGVGTVIRANEVCLSACAIMFMMGTHQGPEIAGLSRTLHVLGTLGFHRPSIKVNSEVIIDAKTIPSVFDGAYSSALGLISLANSSEPWSAVPMMKPDLIQAMLDHIGDDLFFIDTIDRVGRWNIELLGAKLPIRTFSEAAFFACENMIQWQVGTTKQDIALEFVLLEINGLGSQRIRVNHNTAGNEVREVTGLDAGLAGEGCILQEINKTMVGCGFDENTGISFGSKECDLSTDPKHYDYTPAISQMYPWTKLRDLAAGVDEKLAHRKLAKCYVLSAGEILDDKNCFASFHGTSTVLLPIVLFDWPSGNKTVIEVRGKASFINGNKAEQVYIEGYEKCFRNSKTRNDFCFNRID